MSLTYDVIGILTVAVQLVVLFLLIRGPFRKFGVLAVYLAVDLISYAGLTWADMRYGGSLQVNSAHASSAQKLYTHLYWLDDVLLLLLLFLVVIVFTYKALEGSPLRGPAQKLLAGVVIVGLTLPFVLFHPTFRPWPPGSWFNSTSQLLNFGGAIMNLALWAALIGSKKRDPQLLTVSAGLGVVVAGASVSLGLRHFVPQGGFRWIPDLLLLLTHLGGLIVWCYAFRPLKMKSQPARQAMPSLSVHPPV